MQGSLHLPKFYQIRKLYLCRRLSFIVAAHAVGKIYSPNYVLGFYSILKILTEDNIVLTHLNLILLNP